MRLRSFRRYYTTPSGFPLWKPLRRINEFLLDHIGGFSISGPRKRRLWQEDPSQHITTKQIPEAFRRLKLPPGVTCLGTIVRKNHDAYTIVYEVPHGQTLAYTKALVWSLLDAGFTETESPTDRRFFPVIRLPGQPDSDFIINQHGDERQSFITVEVWPVRFHMPDDAEYHLPPLLTLPDGVLNLEEIRADGALPLWPPELTAEHLLGHWEAEAREQGWQTGSIQAAWGGMLHFQKNGFRAILVLEEVPGSGWLVRLPPHEHKQWDEERRAALRQNFKQLEKLATERQATQR